MIPVLKSMHLMLLLSLAGFLCAEEYRKCHSPLCSTDICKRRNRLFCPFGIQMICSDVTGQTSGPNECSTNSDCPYPKICCSAGRECPYRCVNGLPLPPP